MTSVKISMEQMIALHSFLAGAAAAGEAGLAEICGCESEVEVLEIRCSSLADFGDSGLRLSDDMVAAVMGRLEGAIPGTLTLVVEPEDALAWSNMAGADDPVETFVAMGEAILEGITSALGEALEDAVDFHQARLVEESELGMIVQTHAPSDTLVFSTRLQIESRDEFIPAHCHLLVEPKYLSLLLSALSAASH